MDKDKFKKLLSSTIDFKENPYHPLVWINGNPQIGENVYIGGMSEINANGATVIIGDNCDIASFVAINCADSHKLSVGLSDSIDRKDIIIENNVFIGSHSVIKGGALIGHHSVVAAGTIVEGVTIPPYSLVIGNPMQVKEGYYIQKKEILIIPHNKPSIGNEEEIAISNVLKSGWLAQNNEVRQFENEFCEFMGLPHGHAVAVTNGTTALYLALWSLDSKEKVIGIPNYSCNALRNAILMVQGKELLIDSSKETPNVDLEKLEKSECEIAIVPHLYGIPQDLSNVKNKLIIEDCAQSLGAKINNQFVGLQGELGVFSFYATKMITSGGQGGMVISKNKEYIKKIRDFRDFDQKNDGELRFNFQMTEMQATVGRVQLKKLPQYIERRKEIYKLYSESNLPILPINDMYGIEPVPYRAILETPRIMEVIKKLEENNIRSINPLEERELLGDFNNSYEAYKWTQKTVSLPIYPSLTDEEVLKIINVLRNEALN